MCVRVCVCVSVSVSVCVSACVVPGSGPLAKLVLSMSVDGCAGAMDYCFTAPKKGL